jgi:hypothetical protein
MRDPKRLFGPALLLCLVFSFLPAQAGPTRMHPAKPSGPAAHRDLGRPMAPAAPLLLPARSQGVPYDRLACRLACEQIGFWDMERELTQRLINACKIGCGLGQDHCL